MAHITSRDDLRNALNGHQLARCLQVIAELGIADLLADGPKSPAFLAQATQTRSDAMLRLLRVAVSAGVFEYGEDGRCAMNEPGQWLCRDHEHSLHPFAVLAGQQHFPAWGRLTDSLRSGEPAFDLLHGMSAWDYRRTNTAAGRVFDEAMAALSAAFAGSILDAYDFSGFECVVDVGGGTGVFLSALLQRYPELRGVLFDLAPVVESLPMRTELEPGDRCKGVAGSFLEPMPAMGDVYVLQRVLHDWDDKMAIRILANCRTAMQVGQRLLVMERVLGSQVPTAEAALSDMLMLVMNGGCERTEADFRQLLDASGFRLERVVSTRSVLSVVEGSVV